MACMKLIKHATRFVRKPLNVKIFGGRVRAEMILGHRSRAVHGIADLPEWLSSSFVVAPDLHSRAQHSMREGRQQRTALLKSTARLQRTSLQKLQSKTEAWLRSRFTKLPMSTTSSALVSLAVPPCP